MLRLGASYTELFDFDETVLAKTTRDVFTPRPARVVLV